MVFQCGSEKLSRASAIISEVAAVPLYEDQPLLDEQMRILRGLGFELHKFLFFKPMFTRSRYMSRLKRRKYLEQLVDGDAVFVRSLLELDALSSEELKRLTLLAESVFNSPGLALKCLSFLVDRGDIQDQAVVSYADRLPYQSV